MITKYSRYLSIPTVGFGDIYPSYNAGFAKFLICLEIAVGLSFIIVVFGSLVSNLTRFYGTTYDEFSQRIYTRRFKTRNRQLTRRLSGRSKSRR